MDINIFTYLARNLSIRSPRNGCLHAESDSLDSITKEAKSNGLIMTSHNLVDADRSSSFTSIYSKREQKGTNQDCFVVWEVRLYALRIVAFCYNCSFKIVSFI